MVRAESAAVGGNCLSAGRCPDSSAYCRYVLVARQPLVLRATRVKTDFRRRERSTGMKVLKGGRLIDGTGAAPVSGATVVIRDQRIEAVAAGPPRGGPPGGELIDGSRVTMLPGPLAWPRPLCEPRFEPARA